MNILLWILQVLLGAFFVMSGYGKAFMSWESLQRIPWIDGVTHGQIIFIGWSEVLGGVGLILPALTKVVPILTAWAAVGLTTVMVLATGFHLMRGEYGLMILTLVLALLLAFVAYGRFVLKPIR